MAGNYPDVPAQRIAYDRDGSVVNIVYPSGSISSISIAQMQEWNDEDYVEQDIIGKNTGYVAIIFPEPRNIVGYVVCGGNLGGGNGTITTSSDTTNGYDGTWTDHGAYTQLSFSKAAMRNNINAVNYSGITAIRFGVTGNLNGGSQRFALIHLYGSTPLSNSPDRLIVTDLSDSEIAAQLDFADAARGTNQTKSFNIINNSASLTASNITVSLEALMDTNPSLIGQFQLSTDNTNFSNSVNIGDLAPGASSATLFVKNTVASNAVMGLWWLRVVAAAGSWA